MGPASNHGPWLCSSPLFSSLFPSLSFPLRAIHRRRFALTATAAPARSPHHTTRPASSFSQLSPSSPSNGRPSVKRQASTHHAPLFFLLYSTCNYCSTRKTPSWPPPHQKYRTARHGQWSVRSLAALLCSSRGSFSHFSLLSVISGARLAARSALLGPGPAARSTEQAARARRRTV
ncbi:hypothetical protein F5884DRAFT_791920, partial [Xylogone sp. PMI_703]